MAHSGHVPENAPQFGIVSQPEVERLLCPTIVVRPYSTPAPTQLAGSHFGA